MWNKDLKHMQEQSGESLGESIAAFVVGGAAMVAVWVVLAVIASNAV